MSNVFGKINSFVSGTISEIRKCSWPNKDELFESTILVIVGMFILGAFVALLDIGSVNFVNLLTSLGR